MLRKLCGSQQPSWSRAMQGCEASAGSKLVLTSSLVAFPYAYSWKDADVLSWCRVDVDGRESVRELDISMSTFVPKEANLSMFSSVQLLSRVRTLRPHKPQHARPLCPSPTPRVHPNSCPLSRWCHPTISSSVVPIFSCPQSFPASGSFWMS